jgi:hypothetical protein
VRPSVVIVVVVRCNKGLRALLCRAGGGGKLGVKHDKL